MKAPDKSEGCAHAWVCICADRNDALYECRNCGLCCDGHGKTWRPAPPKTEEQNENR